jgi:hypothetical protein
LDVKWSPVHRFALSLSWPNKQPCQKDKATWISPCKKNPHRPFDCGGGSPTPDGRSPETWNCTFHLSRDPDHSCGRATRACQTLLLSVFAFLHAAFIIGPPPVNIKHNPKDASHCRGWACGRGSSPFLPKMGGAATGLMADGLPARMLRLTFLPHQFLYVWWVGGACCMIAQHAPRMMCSVCVVRVFVCVCACTCVDVMCTTMCGDA